MGIMKTRKVDFHTVVCFTCFDMLRRGYRQEYRYWNDYFNHEEKPIKYDLIYKLKMKEVVLHTERDVIQNIDNSKKIE